MSYGWIRGQDPFIDVRPNHDENHWITCWIRNNMEPPLERDEKARMWLLKVSNGAKEIKERWALPFKAPGYWKPFSHEPNQSAKKMLETPIGQAASPWTGVY